MTLQFPNIYVPFEADSPRLLYQVRKTGAHQILSLHVGHCEREALEKLGLFAGGRLQVLMNDNRGTLAVELKGRVVILGRQLTYHTRVLPIPVGVIIPFRR